MPKAKNDRLATLLEPLLPLARDEHQREHVLPDVLNDDELLPNEFLLEFQDSVPVWWPHQRPQWDQEDESKPLQWSPQERRDVLAHQIAHFARQPSASQPLSAFKLVNTLRHIAYGVTLEEPSILEPS